jgi:hypothetical protein
MKVKINDKLDDLEAKYIFVSKWKFLDMLDAEKFQGHPIPGRVYRSLYNNKTDSYRIILNEAAQDGLLVKDINNTSEENGFLSESVVISKSNLLELQLNEEDLDKIINWQETNNSDLFTEMNPIPPDIILRIENALATTSEDQQLMDSALHTASELINVNYDFFDVWIELGQLLVEQSLLDHDSQAVVLSESEGGMSLNIGDVYKALKVYTSDDRKTNLDRSSVHEAMIGLARELVRRNLNELD